MACTKLDTRTKLFYHQIKASDWLESDIVYEYYFAVFWVREGDL